MYVGRKYFKCKRKGVTKESDWRSYYGSCKPLKDEINLLGKDDYKREIIAVYSTKGAVNYAEVEMQFSRDVLKAILPDGTPAYYNRNIASRWFASRETLPPEHRAKIAASSLGKAKSAEARAAMSKAKTGAKRPPMSAAQKAKISAARTGIKERITEEERAKRRVRGAAMVAYQTVASRQAANRSATLARSGLTEDDIRAIRQSTETSAALGARYLISPTHAHRIKTGKTHLWLE